MFESRPIRKGRRRHRPHGRKRRWPILFLALLASGLLLAGGVSVYRDRPKHLSRHAELAGIGESFVRQEIPEEIHTAFSPEEETIVDSQSGNKYLVRGWVDLIQSEGAMERQVFSCVIHKNTWGDWVGEEITLMAPM